EYALARFGPAVVPALIERLKKDLLHAEEKHLQTILRDFGPAAIPSLVKALGSEEGTSIAVQNAMVALGPAAVKPLAELLQHDKTNTRRAAVEMLGRLKEQARPAAESLLKLADDKDPYLRSAVLQALAQID